jgi:hypothetical protein
MLTRFFAILRRPDAFEGDAYGWAASQVGHWAVGLIGASVALLCGAEGWQAAAIVVAAYAVLWEAALQGWRGRDSFTDTGFAGVGAAPAIVAVAASVPAWAIVASAGLGILALVPGIRRRL